MAAPLDERSKHAEEAMASDANNRRISTIVIFTALDSEALPLVEYFKLCRDDGSLFPLGVPWIRFHGYYNGLNLSVIYPGKDPDYGVNSVGTVPASLVTYTSIRALQPDLLINAGTAGGFKVKGACIFDVFLVSDVAFHDRRIPIPGPDMYGLGRHQSFPTPNLVKELKLKVGKLSTGDSLEMSPQDEISIIANDATVVDMEGAAVCYVARLLKVPAIFLKSVTNILDDVTSITEEFLLNLKPAVVALRDVVVQVLEFVNGKSLSEL